MCQAREAAAVFTREAPSPFIEGNMAKSGRPKDGRGKGVGMPGGGRSGKNTGGCKSGGPGGGAGGGQGGGTGRKK